MQREWWGLIFLQKVVELSNKFYCYIPKTSANVNILSETSAPPSSPSSLHHGSTPLNIFFTSLFDLFLLQLIDLTEHIRLLLIIVLLTVTKRQLFIIILAATNLFILLCCIPSMPILHCHFFLLFWFFLTENIGVPSVKLRWTLLVQLNYFIKGIKGNRDFFKIEWIQAG
jgi:hypothetical protein